FRRGRPGRFVPARERAARHLHRHGLARSGGARVAACGGTRGRRGSRSQFLPRPTMTIFSSLTNRIFVASAVLTVVAIAVAVYRVNVAVTAQAENELH